MKIFNSIEEMAPYYNGKTNTYEFYEDGLLIDITINFDFDKSCRIVAGDIKAKNIKTFYLKCRSITALDIRSTTLDALCVGAFNINAGMDIKAYTINALNINARDISVTEELIAIDIKARDITANDIHANNISFYSLCFARRTLVCNTIQGERENSKYICLDNRVCIESERGVS